MTFVISKGGTFGALSRRYSTEEGVAICLIRWGMSLHEMTPVLAANCKELKSVLEHEARKEAEIWLAELEDAKWQELRRISEQKAAKEKAEREARNLQKATIHHSAEIQGQVWAWENGMKKLVNGASISLVPPPGPPAPTKVQKAKLWLLKLWKTFRRPSVNIFYVIFLVACFAGGAFLKAASDQGRIDVCFKQCAKKGGFVQHYDLGTNYCICEIKR